MGDDTTMFIVRSICLVILVCKSSWDLIRGAWKRDTVMKGIIFAVVSVVGCTLDRFTVKGETCGLIYG